MPVNCSFLSTSRAPCTRGTKNFRSITDASVGADRKPRWCQQEKQVKDIRVWQTGFSKGYFPWKEGPLICLTFTSPYSRARAYKIHQQWWGRRDGNGSSSFNNQRNGHPESENDMKIFYWMHPSTEWWITVEAAATAVVLNLGSPQKTKLMNAESHWVLTQQQHWH